MLCPKCGDKLKVKDSRSLKKDDMLNAYGDGTLLYRVGKIITWYTEDFVARRRYCRSCGHEFDSIELEVKDFFGCLATVKDSEHPNAVDKIKKGTFDD